MQTFCSELKATDENAATVLATVDFVTSTFARKLHKYNSECFISILRAVHKQHMDILVKIYSYIY